MTDFGYEKADISSEFFGYIEKFNETNSFYFCLKPLVLDKIDNINIID